ncbi:MAG: lauroyl acyltransferase [Elsteraceae bacterium]
MKPWTRRTFGHPLEAGLLQILFRLLRALPLDAASGLGGWIARTLGPLLPVSKWARRNLALAFPDRTQAARELILRDCWENLGRTFAEYPHLPRLLDERVTVEGLEHLGNLRDENGPALFFSAHLGNWELLPMMASRVGLPLAGIYRAANNPLVDRLLRRLRGKDAAVLFPKGGPGARAALAHLRDGGRLALLVDQKMNDGVSVPFFGKPAMTAPALAQLALRYHCPVFPARIERLHGARFRLIVEPQLLMPDSGDRHADVLATMTDVNAILERWIRAKPEDWLWLHRRWPAETHQGRA